MYFPNFLWYNVSTRIYVSYRDKQYAMLVDDDIYKRLVKDGWNIHVRKKHRWWEIFLYKHEDGKDAKMSIRKYIFPHADKVFYKTRNIFDVRRTNLVPYNKQLRFIKTDKYYQIAMQSYKFGPLKSKIDEQTYRRILGLRTEYNIMPTKWSGHIYLMIKIGDKLTSLHRWIMNAKNGELVDHINRDTLDNRKHNLRLTNKSVNAINSKIRSDNTSGHTGVYWSKQKHKWEAMIWFNTEKRHLGFFGSKSDAIRARVQAERELPI